MAVAVVAATRTVAAAAGRAGTAAGAVGAATAMRAVVIAMATRAARSATAGSIVVVAAILALPLAIVGLGATARSTARATRRRTGACGGPSRREAHGASLGQARLRRGCVRRALRRLLSGVAVVDHALGPDGAADQRAGRRDARGQLGQRRSRAGADGGVGPAGGAGAGQHLGQAHDQRVGRDRGHGAAQRDAGALQVLAGRAAGDAEGLGDLLVRAAFQLAQDQRGALALGQLAERVERSPGSARCARTPRRGRPRRSPRRRTPRRATHRREPRAGRSARRCGRSGRARSEGVAPRRSSARRCGR